MGERELAGCRCLLTSPNNMTGSQESPCYVENITDSMSLLLCHSAKKKPKDRAETHLETRLAAGKGAASVSAIFQAQQCPVPPIQGNGVDSNCQPIHTDHICKTHKGELPFIHCPCHPLGCHDPGGVAPHLHSLLLQPSAGQSGLSEWKEGKESLMYAERLSTSLLEG